MEIWLDTIDSDLIAQSAKSGLIAGVTTNPAILSKTEDVPGTLKRLLDIQPGPVAIQVTAADTQGMIEDGLRISAFSSRAVVKVPMTQNGMRAIAALRQENVPILGTSILFPAQALLAANYETAYISPYFSHMGDYGDARAELVTMQEMLQGAPTRLLVASLRHIDDIIFCASIGAHGVTIKGDLFLRFITDTEAVERFLDKFQADWVQAHGDRSIGEMLKSAPTQ